MGDRGSLPGYLSPALLAITPTRLATRRRLGQDRAMLESDDHGRDLVLAAKAGPGRAREQLIEAFLPHIRFHARRYRNVTAVQHDELMQEGIAGLLTALQRYDEHRENCFWTYASWWVRGAMQGVVSELGGPVVLSDRAARRQARIDRERHENLRLCGREATAAELAREADVSEEDVWSLRAATGPARGLDEPISSRDGVLANFADILADPTAHEAFDDVLDAIASSDVPRLRAALSDREDRVVRGRYGFDGPAQPLREIARSLGVSLERVRQIERVALRKMREAA
jgi:RNA polymerase primary sigma factor